MPWVRSVSALLVVFALGAACSQSLYDPLEVKPNEESNAPLLFAALQLTPQPDQTDIPMPDFEGTFNPAFIQRFQLEPTGDGTGDLRIEWAQGEVDLMGVMLGVANHPRGHLITAESPIQRALDMELALPNAVDQGTFTLRACIVSNSNPAVLLDCASICVNVERGGIVSANQALERDGEGNILPVITYPPEDETESIPGQNCAAVASNRVPANCPDAPTLRNPTGVLGNPADVTFRWDFQAGAVSYDLDIYEIGPDPDNVSTFLHRIENLSPDELNDFQTATYPLVPGEYSYVVTVTNPSCERATIPSDPLVFRVFEANACPTAPSTLEPVLDACAPISSLVEFLWSPDGFYQSFEVQITTADDDTWSSPNLITREVPFAPLQYSLEVNEDPTEYKWRVRSRFDGCDAGPFSDWSESAETFTLARNAVIPVLTSQPMDVSPGQDPSFTFQGSPGHTYEVSLCGPNYQCDPTGVVVSDDDGDLIFDAVMDDPFGPAESGYYFSVSASNACGDAVSDISTSLFQLRECPPADPEDLLASPELICSTIAQIELTWLTNPNVQYYEVEIAPVGGLTGTATIASAWTGVTRNLNAGTYDWAVRGVVDACATSGEQFGNWVQSPVPFSIVDQPAAPTAVTQPSDVEAGTATTTFEWTVPAGYTFEIEFCDNLGQCSDSSAGNFTLAGNQATSSLSLPSSQGNYFRVRSRFSSCPPSLWTNSLPFNVLNCPPNGPTGTDPVPDYCATTQNVSFNWARGESAHSEIEIRETSAAWGDPANIVLSPVFPGTTQNLGVGTYTWRVRDVSGICTAQPQSPWLNAAGNFSIVTPVQSPTIEEVNGDVAPSATLALEHSTTVGQTYTVQICDNLNICQEVSAAGFVTIPQPDSDIRWEKLGPQTSGDNFYFRIQAQKAAASVCPASPWIVSPMFDVKACPPTAPSALVAVADSCADPSVVTFDWVDDGNHETYDLEVRAGVLTGTPTHTAFTRGDTLSLSPGSYNWAIRSSISGCTPGSSNWTTADSFEIFEPATAPTVLNEFGTFGNPANVEFEFLLGDADSYDVEVRLQSATMTGTPTHTNRSSGSTISLSPQNATTCADYQWRVRANRAGCTGVWTGIENFQVCPIGTLNLNLGVTGQYTSLDVVPNRDSTSTYFGDTQVYLGFYSPGTGGDQYKFVRSDDNGTTFGTIENLFTLTGSPEYPSRVKADGYGRVFLIGHQHTPFTVQFLRSTDYGDTWVGVNTNQVYMPQPGGNSCGHWFDMALDPANSGRVMIAYDDYGGNNDQLFVRSDNFGVTWPTAATNISSNNNVGQDVGMDADRTGMIVVSTHVFNNDDLRILMSYDFGENWTTFNPDTTDSVGQGTSAVIGDNGKIGVSYYDDTDDDVKFIYSTNYGVSWPAANIVTIDNNIGNSGWGTGWYTSIDRGRGDTLYVAYYDNQADDLYLATSTNFGQTWSTRTIDTAGDVGTFAMLRVGPDGGVHITYYDTTNATLKYWRGA